VAALLAAALPACGGGGGGGGLGGGPGGCSAGGGPPIQVSGTILYQRLQSTAIGIGPLLETRPARFVDVEVRAEGGGTCYGVTHADALGDYSLLVMPPTGTSIEVRVWSRTADDPSREITTHDADPPVFNSHSSANVFSHASTPFPASGPMIVDLTVPYNPGSSSSRPSIGFGVLDTLVTCWDALATAGGLTPTPLHAYTRLGNNAALQSTSFYRPSAFAMGILGGAAGNLDNSDTDYFDETVLAHEFCHHMERTISLSQTRGGAHSGAPLEPNFAWSEGQASGFGCLFVQNSVYKDSFTTNSSSPAFTFNVENVIGTDPAGIGGELTVAEILWDLGDGGAGPANADSDTLAVPIADLVAAVMTFVPTQDSAYVGTFLDRLVALSAAVDSAQMAAFLAGPPENQGISYPLAGTDVWPTAIQVGDVAFGQVDSLPAMPPNPSVKDPCRGITSSAWYVLVLAVPDTITIDLTISPIAGSGNNLDLFLTTNPDPHNPIAASAQFNENDESIGPISLSAGTYLIRVEANCSGAGNRANFTLQVN
jgi:hypothetical protein